MVILGIFRKLKFWKKEEEIEEEPMTEEIRNEVPPWDFTKNQGNEQQFRGQQFREERLEQPRFNREDSTQEIILARLEVINAKLDSINQRLSNIERMANEKEQRPVRW